MDGESDCEHMDDENHSVPHYEVDVRGDVVWLYGDRADVVKCLGLWTQLMTGCGENNDEQHTDHAFDVVNGAVQTLWAMLHVYPKQKERPA